MADNSTLYNTEKLHTDFDFWFSHRVSYGETDSMGVLYYAEYLHIFERARSQLLRDKGMSYAEVEKRGIILPVREARCRYRKPFRYDDLIRINAGITQWGRASLTFRYLLWNEAQDTLMAEGMTQHAFVDRTGRPVAVPEWLKNLYC